MSDWPLWLVEGLAEYCSPPKWTKKGGADWAGLGRPNPIHLATIRDLDDPMPPPIRGGPRGVGIGPGAGAPPARDRSRPLVEYLVTQKELTPTDYALSWALTHYLATRRLDAFVAYIKRMSQLKPFEEQSSADQLATFREFFGADLAQVEGKVAAHMKQFKSDDGLTFYAVIFEQQIGPGLVRRQAMVSQSPSVIQQWVQSMTAPEGEVPRWQAFPHPTRKQALEAVEQWASQPR
jgi:hypothetical protein